MGTTILDGRRISSELRESIAEAARQSVARGVVPGLATVLVGEHPASVSYIRSKQRACDELGIHGESIALRESATQAEVEAAIRTLNARPDIHGILVQQPLPGHLDAETLVAAIDPGKDVDGFHPANLGRLMRDQPCFIPCTPFGIMKMLETEQISPESRRVVIVGRSLLVGKPLAALLMQRAPTGNATVTVCHSRTLDLASVTKQADILVAAIGRPGYITADMVADGATVIDVGINRVDDATRNRGYRIVGDVDYDSVAPKAAFITPVPGGVGLMTVTMLLYNTVQAAQGRTSLDPLLDRKEVP